MLASAKQLFYVINSIHNTSNIIKSSTHIAIEFNDP